MFCPKCGTQIAEGAKFCPGCGWRVGSSLGKKNVAERTAQNIADRVNKVVGGQDQIELRFKDFFTDVPKRHQKGEIDRLFACGTPETTPSLATVSTEWPHPWVWSRVLAVLMVTEVMLVEMLRLTYNMKMAPGVMFIGAAVINISALVFFFETNVPRDISFPRVLFILFCGGAASLVITLMLGNYIPSGTFEFFLSLMTGLIEEAGKFLIVAAFLKATHRRNYILNGLLIGAAVGAGFALFETAGYAFRAFVDSYSSFDLSNDSALVHAIETGTAAMISSLIVRGLLAIGGHVAWAAAEGGALALCDSGSGFQWGHLVDKRFLSVAGICIVLHGTWDSFIAELLPFYLGNYLLIAVIWVVLVVLLHRGLMQINFLSSAARNQTVAQPRTTA